MIPHTDGLLIPLLMAPIVNIYTTHLRVFRVASWFLSAGLMHAINNVSLLPPSESWRRRVSFAFLYGIWLRFFPSVKALITLPSSIKLLLILTPSENRSPVKNKRRYYAIITRWHTSGHLC